MKRPPDDDGLSSLRGVKRSKRITLTPSYISNRTPPTPDSLSTYPSRQVGLNARMHAASHRMGGKTVVLAPRTPPRAIASPPRSLLGRHTSPNLAWQHDVHSHHVALREPTRTVHSLFGQPAEPMAIDLPEQPTYDLYTSLDLSRSTSPAAETLFEAFPAHTDARLNSADEAASVFRFHPPPLPLSPSPARPLPALYDMPPATPGRSEHHVSSDDVYSTRYPQRPMSAIEQSNFAIYRDDTPIPSWQPYKAKAYSEVSTDSAVGAASMEDPFASQGENFTIYEDAQGDEEEEEME